MTGDDDCTYGDICVKNWDLNSVVTKNGRNSTLSGIYIAIGIQQWGYYGTIASTTSVTCDLNIAFTTEGYFVHTATPTLNGSSRGVVGGAPKSTTQITLSNGNDKINDARWIAIGKQQWGSTSELAESASVTFTYPIAFASAVYSCCIQQKTGNNNGEYINAGYLTSYSKSSCILQNWAYANTAYWLLFIGKQQWGLFNSTSTTGTINLPLTMPSADYKIMITMLNSCASCGVQNVTTSSFYYFTRDENGTTKRPAYWLIVGNQQWGNVTTQVNDGTVTLPISFTTTTYFATMDPTENASHHTNNVTIFNRTNSSFEYEFYAGHMTRTWFCIGYQQWGTLYFATDTSQTITYPIAFSTIYTVIVGVSSTGEYRGGNVWTASKKTNINFVCTSPGDMSLLSGDWIALGKQQWGKLTHTITHLTSDRTVTLPISISTLLSCITTTIGDEYQACNASYKSHTTNSIVIRDGGVNDASRLTGFYWCCLAI